MFRGMLQKSFAIIMAGAAVAATSGFARPSISKPSLAFPASAMTMTMKHFDLDVEIFSGTQWTDALVRQHVFEINRVYSACNIEIGNLHVTTIAAPTGELNLYRDIQIRGPGGLHDAAVALGRTSTLTLMLIRQFQEGIGGTAGIPSVYARSLPEMVNRAWVTEETLEPTYIAARDLSYVPEAHEIGHILLNEGHVSGRKNLMADDYRDVNGELDISQCALIRSSTFVY